jgi:hypothetical protein
MPVSRSSVDGDSSNWRGLRTCGVGLHRAALVDRTAEHVHHATEDAGRPAPDVLAGALYLHAALEAVGAAHRDRAHDAVAKLLLDLEGKSLLGELAAAVLENQRVVDLRHRFARKLDVDDRADGLDDGAVSL